MKYIYSSTDLKLEALVFYLFYATLCLYILYHIYNRKPLMLECLFLNAGLVVGIVVFCQCGIDTFI